MLELASSGYITATDLADYIVKNHTRSFINNIPLGKSKLYVYLNNF